MECVRLDSMMECYQVTLRSFYHAGAGCKKSMEKSELRSRGLVPAGSTCLHFSMTTIIFITDHHFCQHSSQRWVQSHQQLWLALLLLLMTEARTLGAVSEAQHRMRTPVGAGFLEDGQLYDKGQSEVIHIQLLCSNQSRS